jgi:hypothetical protein
MACALRCWVFQALSSGVSRPCWNYGSVVVTVDVWSFFRPFQGRRLWAARHSFQHALVNRINRCQSCLKFSHKVFDSPWRDYVNVLLLLLPQETFHRNEIRWQSRICSRSSTSNPPTWICRLSKIRTSSPQGDRASSWWNLNCWLIKRGTSSSSPVEYFSHSKYNFHKLDCHIRNRGPCSCIRILLTPWSRVLLEKLTSELCS